MKPKPKLSPIGNEALRGLHLAFAKVVEQHRQWGEPLILWRDGKVVYEYVDQSLEVAEDPGDYSTSSKLPADCDEETGGQSNQGRAGQAGGPT